MFLFIYTLHVYSPLRNWILKTFHLKTPQEVGPCAKPTILSLSFLHWHSNTTTILILKVGDSLKNDLALGFPFLCILASTIGVWSRFSQWNVRGHLLRGREQCGGCFSPEYKVAWREKVTFCICHLSCCLRNYFMRMCYFRLQVVLG